jgi:hypothetical protein
MHAQTLIRTSEYTIDRQVPVDKNDPDFPAAWFVVTEIQGDFGEIVFEADTKEECLAWARKRYDVDPDVKYPSVLVPMTGEDGNALFIIGRVAMALKRAGVSPDEIVEFRAEAMSGDYDNVIQTVMRWVSVS